MQTSYFTLGRLAYWFLRPFIRIVIRRTRRVYVVLLSGDSVLLVKSWLGDGAWHLPGGGKKKGEESLSAAIRETREETQISLKSDELQFLLENNWRSGGTRYPYTIYTGQMANQVNPTYRRFELIDAAWVPIAELESTIAPEILGAISYARRSL